MLQATCRAAELLRARRGRNALVSSVSGVLTKQGFGLWSVAPAPHGFVNADLSDAVARDQRVLEVDEDFSGSAAVAGYTVLHGRAQAPRALALVDTTDARRALVESDDAALIGRLQEEEFVGRQVRIEHNRWLA